ncbi:MAG TPA: class I SAM-dependent methyltransferase [Actinomycetota bacterium]|nr:class I SAM-dependent methyltransferase [Actinomycetota bacterium]
MPTESYDEGYFRTLYGEGARQTRFDRARDDRVVRMVRRHAPPRREGSALLDIGCGYGYLLGRFRGRYRLVGIDVSAHAVGQATGRIPGALVVTADVQRALPFDHRFDVVLAINVVEHLADPASAAAAVRDALVPAGLCVIHLPTINGPVSRAIYRLAYERDPTHVYRPSGRQVRRLFEEAGFQAVEVSYAPHVRWLSTGWHPALLAAFLRR